jgi:hypothetical protein
LSKIKIKKESNEIAVAIDIEIIENEKIQGKIDMKSQAAFEVKTRFLIKQVLLYIS